MRPTAAGARAFRCVELGPADRGSLPDAIGDIYEKRLHAVIVRGFIPKSAAGAVVARLERGALRLERVRLPGQDDPGRGLHDKPFIFGKPLSLSEDLDSAVRRAAPFRKAIGRLFGKAVGYEDRLKAVFRGFSGGRPVELIGEAEGRALVPATFRVVRENGWYTPHWENDVFGLPFYRDHLNALIDQRTLISHFTVLSAPVSGGQLVTYGLPWPGPREARDGSPVYTDVKDAYQGLDRVVMDPREGDLILFDAGRFLHGVDRIAGPRPRWTVGGAVGFSRDRSTVLYWG